MAEFYDTVCYNHNIGATVRTKYTADSWRYRSNLVDPCSIQTTAAHYLYLCFQSRPDHVLTMSSQHS